MQIPVRTPGLGPADPSLLFFLEQYYAQRYGSVLPFPEYPPLNIRFLHYCADNHDRAIHCPDHPATRRAYDAFCAETERQFCMFREIMLIELWPRKGEPYVDSNAMRRDVRENAHLWVLPTGEIPADHPLAQRSSINGWLLNELFRATHDLATHAPYGFSFGPRGEEAACRAHAQLYPEEALPALVAETRMQSAWVFFGAHLRDLNGRIPQQGEKHYVPLHNRPFPSQKAFAAPTECLSEAAWRQCEKHTEHSVAGMLHPNRSFLEQHKGGRI